MSRPPESVVVAGPRVNAGCRVQPPRHRGGETGLDRRTGQAPRPRQRSACAKVQRHETNCTAPSRVRWGPPMLLPLWRSASSSRKGGS